MEAKALAIVVLLSCSTVHGAADVKLMKINRALTEETRSCLACHAEEQPGIVHDWKNSGHSDAGVSCIDCHRREKDSPMAAQNCPGVEGTDVFVSALVTPKTCAECHPEEVNQFNQSGHVRAAKQIIPKKGLQALKYVHEGQNHPEFKGGPDETGCMQCHGASIKLDADRKPLSETWPNAGIGTMWPDDSIGSCTSCHTRHKFDIAEARKPEACASCHLGPDHPNIEIFNSSKHGHIYKTEGGKYDFDSAPDAWEPGDYRAPTCAVCHMSGIGNLRTTHNISRRLHWNLWAKVSKKRNSTDPFAMLTGDAVQGREEMKQVCANCHGRTHIEGFFKQADKQVELYNELRAAGKQITIVGVSDAHGCDGQKGGTFGWQYTIAFAESPKLADVTAAIKDCYSVAMEVIPTDRPRPTGPLRLGKLALFCEREIFPMHDELCVEEGRLMQAHLAGDESAVGALAGLQGRTAALYDRLWARS